MQVKKFFIISKTAFFCIFSFVFFLFLELNVSNLFAQAPVPIPDPPVKCTKDTQFSSTLRSKKNEFHSLRPHQANPCYSTAADLSWLCGNDLILSDTMTVSPFSNGSDCSENQDTLTCTYIMPRGFTVEVDPSESDFPIAGNTQKVPNSQSQENEIEKAERVNEYLSWYLNGSYKIAEEPASEDSEEGVDQAINYSGPLNKLTPWDIQANERIESVENVPGSRDLNEDNKIEGPATHNQVVVCTTKVHDLPQFLSVFEKPLEGILDALVPGILANKTVAIPCYQGGATPKRLREWAGTLSIWNTTSNLIGHFVAQAVSLGFPFIGYSDVENALANHWNKRVPPLPWNFKEPIEYYKAYREWSGATCALIKTLGSVEVMLCVDNPLVKNEWAEIFSYLPMSSNEDRTGKLTVGKPEGGGNGIEVINPVFTGKNTSTLYFPHMAENKELAQILQSNYLPKDIGENQQIGATKAVDTSNKCKILEVRRNDGDNIFGEKTLGIFRYTAKFQCDYQIVYEETCDTLSNGKQVNCRTTKTYKPSECQKTATFTSKIKVGTPLIDDIWKRLVAGNMGDFKRIFPNLKLGKLGKIIDIPAVTPVKYASNSELTAAAAVSPSNPEIYFPHLGGISEYFLKGIQTMLRPKGYGDPIIFGDQEDTSTTGATCDTNAPDVSIPGLISKEDFADLATRWVAGNGNNQALECYNDVVTKAQAAGVDPALALAVWLNESGASNYDVSVLDFGVISAPEMDFNAQIAKFLNSASSYKASLPECQSNGVENDLQAFALIYATGHCNPNATFPGPGGETKTGIYYYEKLSEVVSLMK